MSEGHTCSTISGFHSSMISERPVVGVGGKMGKVVLNRLETYGACLLEQVRKQGYTQASSWQGTHHQCLWPALLLTHGLCSTYIQR